MYFRPAEVDYLRGDYSKAKKILGWKPKISFKELVKEMVEKEASEYLNFIINFFIFSNIFIYQKILFNNTKLFFPNLYLNFLSKISFLSFKDNIL